MQALVGTDEVESVDPTMLIPVSILWWQKCCLLLCLGGYLPSCLSDYTSWNNYFHSILLLETCVVMLYFSTIVTCVL
jgi:hypothetical protein